MTAVPGDRIVVLDDDPTGTQTVSDVAIVLSPDRASLDAAAAQSDGPVWVLTNIRAMSWERARPQLVGIVADVRAAFGPATQLVLRGDSTLRGHVLGEIDVLSSPGSVAMFVPAFVEQGRITIGGVHYVTVDGRRVEVASTEYARDADFSYTTSDLVQWVHDREPGRPAVGIPLKELRTEGAQAVKAALLAAPAHAVVVPDVESVDDLRIIRDGWLAAQRVGRSVVLRCAASMASVATGSSARIVAPRKADGPILLVCGSHTQGATDQLAALDGVAGMVRHEVDPARVLSGATGDYLEAVVAAVSDSLRAGRLTVVSTTRVADPAYLGMTSGEAIMDFLVTLVGGLPVRSSTVITKGGITSARIARDALHAPIADVRGQILPGIPLWTLHLPDGREMEQVVVPGNIGDRNALRDIVEKVSG
jgi:uncharacterized protein YgbK (DUF1537 family)